MLKKELKSFALFLLCKYTLFMFKSASKVAFLLITLSLCIFTALGIVEATDFIALATGVFGYYFWRWNQPPQ